MAPVKSIKVEYNGELRRFATDPFPQFFADLAAHVRALFSIADATDMPALSYRDEDGDLVRISSDDELLLAWRLHQDGIIPGNTLRIIAASHGLPRPAPTAAVTSGTLAVAAPAAATTPVPCRRKGCLKCAKNQAKARFVKDVTVEKGQTMEPGATFTKTWRFRNEGGTAWSRGTYLLHLPKNSDDLGGPSVVPMAADEVLPGQEVDVAVDLTAPSQPGRYVAYYRLYDPARGKKFGQRVWVEILVISGSSSSDPEAWHLIAEESEKKPKKKAAKPSEKSKAKRTSAAAASSSGSSEDEAAKKDKKAKKAVRKAAKLASKAESAGLLPALDHEHDAA